MEDGGSLTGSRCFWIAAPVGSDDAFFLPDSGLFTEYGADRRAVLLASLNAGTDDLSDGCTFLLPPEQGWPLLRWEQPLSDEERLAAARQTAAGEVEDAFAAAIARVQARLAAVTDAPASGTSCTARRGRRQRRPLLSWSVSAARPWRRWRPPGI